MIFKESLAHKECFEVQKCLQLWYIIREESGVISLIGKAQKIDLCYSFGCVFSDGFSPDFEGGKLDYKEQGS